MERVKNLVVVSPGCSDHKLGLVAAQRAWIVAIPVRLFRIVKRGWAALCEMARKMQTAPLATVRRQLEIRYRPRRPAAS